MSPTLALYYTFHTTSASPALVATQASQAYPRLGPTEAFDELISRGCSLATKPWVENHWRHESALISYFTSVSHRSSLENPIFIQARTSPPFGTIVSSKPPASYSFFMKLEKQFIHHKISNWLKMGILILHKHTPSDFSL